MNLNVQGHDAPIIRTKLHRPVVSLESVCRKRLHTLLDGGVGSSLTLVSAPAGYGKSVLVSEWVDAREVPFAWVSLDPSDSDLPTFVTYLIASIRTVAPGALPETERLVATPNPVPMSVLAGHLVNEMDDLDGGLHLILDDFHRIKPTSEVHEFLQFFLEHKPRGTHLVLITRCDPPLNLTAFRSGSGLAEVRLRDLQFRPEEVRPYVRQISDLDLGDAALANLVKQTEGWAVGIQLVALHLRRAEDPLAFLEDFQGGVARSQDYLLNEVLASQPPVVLDFLMVSSLLDRFSADLLDALCLAVDGPSDTDLSGAEFLEIICRENLFTVRLDTKGKWFRFHHLFQELLQRDLKKKIPQERVRDNHRLASAWFESKGLVDEAIQHALSAGNDIGAAEMIEKRRDGELLADRWRTVETWMAMLPTEVKAKRQGLLLTEAWIAYYRVQIERVGLLLAQAEALPQEPTAVPNIEADLAFFRGFLKYWEGEGQASSEILSAGLVLCGTEESFCAAEIMIYLTLARCMVGQKYEGLRFLEEKVQGALTQEGLYPAHLFGGLGISRLIGGNLDEARVDGQRAFHVATKAGVSNSEAWGSYIEAVACLNSGSLEQSLPHFSRVAERRYSFDTPCSTDALAGLSVAQQLLGLESEATATLDLQEEFARESNDLFCIAMAESARYRVALLRGDQPGAAAWAGGDFTVPVAAELVLWFEVPAITRLRALISLGAKSNLTTAETFLDEIQQGAQAHHFTNQAIEVAVLKPVLLEGLGRPEDAQQALGVALGLAEPGGWVRPFIEAGAVMNRLLQRRWESGSRTQYLERLLDVPGPSAVPSGRSAVSVPSDLAHLPLEDLTNREIDVLELLAKRFHNKEIAENLCISSHTVNFHLKQIYSKLEAHNRRQAVDRGLELGILDMKAKG